MQTVTVVQGGSQHRGERRSLGPYAVDGPGPVARDVAAVEVAAAGDVAAVVVVVGTAALAVVVVGRKVVEAQISGSLKV